MNFPVVLPQHHSLHLSCRSQIQIRADIYTANKTILDSTGNKKANLQYLSCVTLTLNAKTYLQLPLRQWGAGNVYLLVLSSWKVNIAENPIAVPAMASI